MRDALVGDGRGGPCAMTARQHRGGGYNSNMNSVNAAEATARVQAAMNYRKQQHTKAPAVHTAEDDEQCSDSSESRSQDAAARVLGMQAKLGASVSAANPRAKAALFKALQYKQGRETHTQFTDARVGTVANTTTRVSAVQLVSVEDKAIDGVDYSAVDARAAAAGESEFIQAACMPVTSYRTSQDLNSSGTVELTATGDPQDAVEMLQKDASVHASSATSDIDMYGVSSVSAPGTGKISSAHLSEVCVPTSPESLEDGRDVACRPGENIARNLGHEETGQAGGGWDSEQADVRADAGHESSAVACPGLAPTAAAGDCGTAVALIELRGKQAAATAAVEASATAAILALTREDDVSICFDGGEGGLISTARSAARRAQHLHQEFDEARQSVMQMLRHGADTYCGGLMLLRRFL